MSFFNKNSLLMTGNPISPYLSHCLYNSILYILYIPYCLNDNSMLSDTIRQDDMLPFQLPPCPNNDPTLQYLGRTRDPTISRQCARSFNGTNSEPFPPTKNRRLNNTRQCVLVNGQGSSLTVSFEIYQSL